MSKDPDKVYTVLRVLRRRLFSICVRQLKITSKYARVLRRREDVSGLYNDLLDIYNELKEAK